MDPLIALLIVVTSVLTVLLVIVGIYVIMILREVHVTLRHVNRTLNGVDSLTKALSQPFSGMGDTIAGIKSGLKVAETFVGWLKERDHDK